MSSSLPSRLSQFDFDLPEAQIAAYPLAERSASRLLCLARDGSGAAPPLIAHRQFFDLPALLGPDDLLVLNDTKVMPARLYAEKTASGGKVEMLIERVLDENTARVHLKANQAPKVGSALTLLDGPPPSGQRTAYTATVVAREAGYFTLAFKHRLLDLLDDIGCMPLPPYIKRQDTGFDRERYQTVYAKQVGAVAAPTAGLHFDAAVFEALAKRGVDIAYVTLHVGAGTFQPVRTETIAAHKMHSEYIEVSAETCAKIQAVRRRGGRIIAGGTTSVRALESVAQASKPDDLQPFAGETDIFITPGYRFSLVDAMITNFHLPKSTLIMLVCAFAGYENTLAAYQQAIAEGYRFFSYGDAMFIS